MVNRIAIVACVGAVVAAWPAPASAESGTLALKHSVVATYASIVHAGYEDAAAGVGRLSQAVDTLLDRPSEESLNAARQAWIASRIPYTQTEAFRFYDGPIESVEGFVNSWPIDENLIDYVEDEPGAGIINQPGRYPRITKELVTSLNEKGGEKNITTGFHAVEFLLWGQDLNDDGPGRRPFTDFLDGGAPHADRRREYLRIVSRLLVEHLEWVAAEWAPDDPANYRTRFLAMPVDAALTCIFKGIGVLSGAELAGERLTVPYETKEQEDEHSCFSDNTHRDVEYDAIGIQNIVLGRYVRPNGELIDGPGVRDLLVKSDPALAGTLARQTAESVESAAAVPEPFDRTIQGPDTAPGRIAVKRLIAALRAQADSIARAGDVLGLKLNF